MKTLSAGIIFMTEDKDLFMGRVTGSRKPGMMAHRWDIPKGRVENSVRCSTKRMFRRDWF